MKNDIINILKQCYDPEIPIDLWNLGLIYDIDISEDRKDQFDIHITMSLTTPGCTMGQHMADDIKKKIIDLEKINSSGEIKLKSNTSNPITDLDSDRIDIIYYFYQSLFDIKPSGLANVNIDYQSYSAIQISEEMYFTNRTLPSYLLTRYSTQNFGTGNYSVLKYVPNVQNLLIS